MRRLVEPSDAFVEPSHAWGMRSGEVRSSPLIYLRSARPGAGGISLFLGTVRDANDGRAVTLLEYHAYPELAVAEMGRILDEIEAEIPHTRVAIAHRTGALEVGDLAVVAAASAPHRAEAFRACRLVIDRVKARVPIWKREHGPDGPYWVGFTDARCSGEEHHPHAHVAEPSADPRP